MKEVCPVCAEQGITELREVTTKEEDGKTIKTYSPCGHKSVLVAVEDDINVKDEAKVNKQVTVKDEIKIKDSFSVAVVAESVLQGYNNLSGTFNVAQANIARSLNLEDNIRELVRLTGEQVTHSKTESKDRKKKWYITTALALIALLIAILGLLRTFNII